MRWIRGDEPDNPGRYAVYAGGSWIAANWRPGYGWFDGYRKVQGVRAYYPVPEISRRSVPK